MKQLFALLLIAGTLISCGGKSGGIKQDTPADFTLTELQIKDIAAKDDAARATYEGKVVEIKGTIQSCKASKTSASPNKFSFYLCSDPALESHKCTICYTDTDQTANVGKSVTVKGHFDYAGVVTLNDCVVY
ncbi:MAG: hypothetical protein JNM68_07635 [Dinghuibacter sp.]|nr:hypothetical protein [Dinghuibacter sp.]